LEKKVEVNILLSTLGAFLFAKMIFSRRSRHIVQARFFAIGACLAAGVQQANQPNVTIEHWLLSIFGTIGLVWIGLVFGAWLADRNSPQT
jgi:hypothetical protein